MQRVKEIQKIKKSSALEFKSSELFYVYFVDSEGQIGSLPIEVQLKNFSQFLEQFKDVYLVITNSENITLIEIMNQDIYKVSPKYRESVYQLLEECNIDTREAKLRGI